MGFTYERELKRVLTADEDYLAWAEKQLPPEQSHAFAAVRDAPFLVLRAAGSFGCDLVALRRDIAFPIEVKSSVDERIHFASRNGSYAEQADEFAAETSVAGVLPMYFFRLKGVRGNDPWRVFTLPVDDHSLSGRAAVLARRLPTIGSSDAGNLIMVWDEGMPLHKFIDYLCSGLGSPGERSRTAQTVAP